MDDFHSDFNYGDGDVDTFGYSDSMSSGAIVAADKAQPALSNGNRMKRAVRKMGTLQALGTFNLRKHKHAIPDARLCLNLEERRRQSQDGDVGDQLLFGATKSVNRKKPADINCITEADEGDRTKKLDVLDAHDQIMSANPVKVEQFVEKPAEAPKIQGALLSHLNKLFHEIKLVADMQETVLRKLPHMVSYKTQDGDTVIFRQGDSPDLCYIILSGQVALWRSDVGERAVKKKQFVEGTASAQEHGRVIAKLMSIKTMTTAAAEHQRAISAVSLIDSLGTQLLALGCGTCFGETGLLDDGPRSASATTLTDCELLVIHKDDFNNVIKSELEKARVRHVARLTRQLLREFDFFKKLSDPVQEAVPAIMHYENWKKGFIPFHEGDPPGRCFILLSGEVGVWKKSQSQGKAKKDEGVAGKAIRTAGNESAQRICNIIAERLKHTLAENSHHKRDSVAFGNQDKFGTQFSMQSAAGSREVDPLRFASTSSFRPLDPLDLVLKEGESSEFGSLVTIMGPGILFGELALLESQPRLATVTCNKACDFLVIERADFDVVLKEELSKERSRMLPMHLPPLINEIPFFAGLGRLAKEMLPFYMSSTFEKAGKVIFWEGDPPGCCYFLLSGRLSVWSKEQNATPKASSRGTVRGSVFAKVAVQAGSNSTQKKCNDILAVLLPADTDHEAEAASSEDAECSFKIADTAQRKSTDGKRYSALGGLQVARIEKGVLFGEAALMNNKPRSATIKCERDCRLLVIQKTDFDTILREEVKKHKVKVLGPQIERLLQEFSFFGKLEARVLSMVPDVVHYARAHRGAVLFEQGAAPSFCYVILSGEVTVWKHVTVENQGNIGIDEEARQQHRLFHQQERKDKHEKVSHKRANELKKCSSLVTAAKKFQKEEPALTSEEDSNTPPFLLEPVPPLQPVEAATRFKCMALAKLLAEVEQLDAAKWTLDDENFASSEEFGAPVASLGPGLMFGELGLTNDHPRDATVTCREDCEFLYINKVDFDRILKTEIKKRNQERWDFLKANIPSGRLLPDSTGEALLRIIEVVTMPRNHHFVKNLEVPDGTIYFVWKGTVECLESMPLPREKMSTPRGKHVEGKEEVVNRGILMEGSVFGSVTSQSRMPYAIVAASASCELLRIAPENLKQLPDSLVQSLRELIEITMSRRMKRRPLSDPMADLFSKSGGKTPRGGGVVHPLRPLTSGVSRGRPMTTGTVLPPAKGAKGLIQLTSGDLNRNMHLNNLRDRFAEQRPRVRPASARAGATNGGDYPEDYVMTTSAHDTDRQRQLRSDASDKTLRRSACSSRADLRESSQKSRARSAEPNRPMTSSSSQGLIDTGSRSPSRGNLRAALKASGERPFVEVSVDDGGNESGLFSKAGKHPACNYSMI